MKACLNGSRTKKEHPRVPVTPEEIGRDVTAVVLAGATAVHIHPRDAGGSETLDPVSCGAAIRSAKSACPDVPVGLSTASWIEHEPRRKLALISSWDVRPDFASVNLNEEGAHEVRAQLLAMGIGVEAGLWSVADARRMFEEGLKGPWVRTLVEVREPDPASAVKVAMDIDACLDEGGSASPRVHHGYGLAAWSVLENAVKLGRGIRIGLEDTTVLPHGFPARGNKDLVQAAASTVKQYRPDAGLQLRF